MKQEIIIDALYSKFTLQISLHLSKQLQANVNGDCNMLLYQKCKNSTNEYDKQLKYSTKH